MRLAQIAALPLMASTSVRTRSKEIAIARSASQDTRRGRVAALLIAVALLLAVVAAASNHPIGAHMSGVGTAPARDTVSALWVLALVALGLVATVIAPMLRSLFRRRDPEEPVPEHPPVRARWAWLALVLAAALGLGVVFVVGVLQHSHPPPLVIGRFGAAPPSGATPLRRTVPASGLSDGVIAAGIGMVVLIGAFWLGVLVRSRQGRGSEEVAGTAALRAVIDDSLADLDSGLTPRAAVIRSYMRMEEVLARHQLLHRASEAPREYLARARTVLGASADRARSITELFEEARFSTHEVDEPMRQDAITALTALRAELGHGRSAPA
jgi:Domain of unknown function (DUF4129)